MKYNFVVNNLYKNICIFSTLLFYVIKFSEASIYGENGFINSISSLFSSHLQTIGMSFIICLSSLQYSWMIVKAMDWNKLGDVLLRHKFNGTVPDPNSPEFNAIMIEIESVLREDPQFFEYLRTKTTEKLHRQSVNEIANGSLNLWNEYQEFVQYNSTLTTTLSPKERFLSKAAYAQQLRTGDHVIYAPGPETENKDNSKRNQTEKKSNRKKRELHGNNSDNKMTTSSLKITNSPQKSYNSQNDTSSHKLSSSSSESSISSCGTIIGSIKRSSGSSSGKSFLSNVNRKQPSSSTYSELNSDSPKSKSKTRPKGSESSIWSHPKLKSSDYTSSFYGSLKKLSTSEYDTSTDSEST